MAPNLAQLCIADVDHNRKPEARGHVSFRTLIGPEHGNSFLLDQKNLAMLKWPILSYLGQADNFK